MKKMVPITALVCGVLFLLVPRYILPACEYAGHARMHCSDTAQAEYVVGALLILAGGLTVLVKSPAMPLAGAAFSCVLFGLAFWLPDIFGYCRSPKMPCNYGMVPAVRFVSVVGLLIMIGAVVAIVNSRGKKGGA
jgi:hypothetical protein